MAINDMKTDTPSALDSGGMPSHINLSRILLGALLGGFVIALHTAWTNTANLPFRLVVIIGTAAYLAIADGWVRSERAEAPSFSRVFIGLAAACSLLVAFTIGLCYAQPPQPAVAAHELKEPQIVPVVVATLDPKWEEEMWRVREDTLRKISPFNDAKGVPLEWKDLWIVGSGNPIPLKDATLGQTRNIVEIPGEGSFQFIHAGIDFQGKTRITAVRLGNPALKYSVVRNDLVVSKPFSAAIAFRDRDIGPQGNRF